jgi:hypothetical protein
MEQRIALKGSGQPVRVSLAKCVLYTTKTVERY